MASGDMSPLRGFTPSSLPEVSDIEAAKNWNDQSIQEIRSELNELISRVHLLSKSAHPQDLIKEAERFVKKLEGRVSQQSPSIGSTATVREIAARELLEEELTGLTNFLSRQSKLAEEHDLREKVDVLRTHNQERLVKIKPDRTNHDAITFKQLTSIKDNREIIEKSLYQIQVLDQFKDGTSSGGENCGYHALKNALLALSPDETSIQEVFKDQKLFQTFYEQYCKPVIKGVKGGKRDATIPRLEEIIDRIRSDSSPPKELMPIYQAVTGKDTAQSLVFFQMTTTTGDESGDPLMAFYESRSVGEALKLYDFAVRPGPHTLSTVFGNESMGHWYTLVIHKDEKGELHFLGCDSMDNTHDMVGNFSSLAKMVRLITIATNDPPTLIEKAYAPLDEVISPRSGWIDPDLGEIDPSNAELLLDTSPNASMATKDNPTKSYQDWVIEHCLKAYELVVQGGWTEKENFQNSLWMSNLRALTDFYATRLPANHPKKETLAQITGKLSDYRLSMIVEPAFRQMEEDQKKLKSADGKDKLSPFALSKFEFARKHMHDIYRNANAIASVEEQGKRELEADKLAGGAGAVGVEPGFFGGGDTQRKRFAGVMHRVFSLLLTHAKAKKANKLPEMVKDMASGDPCLTAIMSRVELFAQKLAGMGQIRETDKEKIGAPLVHAINQALDMIVAPIANANEDMAAGDREAVEALRGFDERILQNDEPLRKIANTLKLVADPESALAKPFLSFLLHEGLIHDFKNIDWEKVTLRLFDLPEFNDWFRAARQQTIVDYQPF